MTPEHFEWVRNHLTEIFQQPGLNRFLGLQIIEVAEGKIVLSMEVAEEHGNILGYAHGGTLASFADVTMGFPCMTLGKLGVTIDMNISYIDNAPTGSRITGVGRIISNGNRIIRSVGEIYDGEKLLVTAQASYYVVGDFTKDDHPPLDF